MDKLYKFPFEILNKAIDSDKISHAYLFSGDKTSLKLGMAKYFAKMLFCSEKKNGKPCQGCYYCENIENNSFMEVKIVDPPGLVIKKEEILNLKEEFSKEGLESGKRVYIINDADRLNDVASNSLLKFLEEPNSDVVAILVTNNPNKLLSTIRSRCQLILFNSVSSDGNQTYKIASMLRQNQSEIDERIQNGLEEFIKNAIDFIKKLDKNKEEVFLFQKKLWLDKFKTKEEFHDALNLIIFIYIDIINYYYINKIDVFNEEEEYIKKIIEKRNINCIIKRVNKFIDIEEQIKYNVNLNLLLDKLILEFE